MNFEFQFGVNIFTFLFLSVYKETGNIEGILAAEYTTISSVDCGSKLVYSSILTVLLIELVNLD